MSAEFKQDSKDVLEAVARLEEKLGIKLEPFSKDINVKPIESEFKAPTAPILSLDKLPNPKPGEKIKCHMCANEPFGPVIFCDCCNHPYCVDCVDKVNQTINHPFIKADFKGDIVGSVKFGSLLVTDKKFFCFCNASHNLHLGLRDRFGKSIHFQQPEQEKIYQFKKIRAVKLERLYAAACEKHPSTTLEEFLTSLSQPH